MIFNFYLNYILKQNTKQILSRYTSNTQVFTIYDLFKITILMEHFIKYFDET